MARQERTIIGPNTGVIVTVTARAVTVKFFSNVPGTWTGETRRFPRLFKMDLSRVSDYDLAKAMDYLRWELSEQTAKGVLIPG